ncbi:MAG: hypothetical protein HY898_16425 [Deltaproteobacteria bacterium]|nr:hypothetical protein [Deltaproteobacteria bacterium]
MRKTVEQFFVAVAIALLQLASSKTALAQDIKGAFRLGFEGVLYAQDSMTVSASSGPVATGDVNVKTRTTGVLPSALGLGVGYAPSSHVLLGVHFLAASTKTEVDLTGAQPTSGTQWSILPSLALLTRSQGVVRPFFETRVGWRGASTEVAGTETSSTSMLVVGGGAGLHIFANDHVTLDPAFNAYYTHGTYKDASTEMTGSGFTVMACVALSAWFGTKPSPWDPLDSKQWPTTGRAEESSAPAAGPTEPLPSEDATVRLEPRVMSLLVPVNPSSSLYLTGVPDRSGTTLLLQWRATGTPPWTPDCKTLTVVMGGTEHPIPNVGQRSGGEAYGTWMGIGGSFGSQAVIALGEARDSRLVACGASLELAPAAKQISDFGARFRSAAIRAGTWRETPGSTPPKKDADEPEGAPPAN